MKTLKLLALLAGLLAGAAANADQLTPQEPRYIGNERSERIREHLVDPNQVIHQGDGCPQGTVSVAFAPDNLSFSVFFDRFIVETQPNPAQQRSTKACKVIVPIQIPAGIQLEITRVDFRGFADIPRQAAAQIKSSYAFTSSSGFSSPVMLQYDFRAPISSDYALYAAGIRQNQRSACGGETRIIMDNNLGLISNNRNQSAMLTLDTVDSASRVVYHMNWMRCGGGGGHPGGPGGPGGPVTPPPPRPPRF